jgi:hypothetical protein
VRGAFAALPAAHSAKPRVGKKTLADTLFRNRTLDLRRSPGLGVLSRPGESERDFRIRLGELAREERDRVKEALRKKYAPRIAALEDRVRRAQARAAREAEQATQQKIQTAISVGTTLLGALFGRKRVSATTLGRATTAARGAARTAKESQDVDRALETVEALARERTQIESELAAETDRLAAAIDPLTEALDRIALRPKKANVSVRAVALAWAPFWRKPEGEIASAWE